MSLINPDPTGDLLEESCIRTRGNSADFGLTPNSWPTVPGLSGDDVPIFDKSNLGKWRLDTYVLSDLIDMNGDGLPDMVRANDYDLLVALNNGASFEVEEKWANLDLPYIGYDRIICDPGNSWDGDPYDMWCADQQGSFLQDCSGDGIPDLLSVSSDSSQWYCRENIHGKAGRLKSIINGTIEREITLRYKDYKPVYDDPVQAKNFAKRSVLESVEISYGEQAPVPKELRYYSYKNGVEDESRNRFLGWEQVRTLVVPSNAVHEVYNYYESRMYDLSETAGYDESGVNLVPDEYSNGLLRQKETGYLHYNEYSPLNTKYYRYSTIPVLNDVDEVKFTYLSHP